MQRRIINGDSLEELDKLEANSIDCLLTDPPYGLAFMGKEWDSFKDNQAYQKWTEEWAKKALRVLKPGAFGLVFCGTRMVHRLTCGLEDAGFEIRDVVSWLYLSGFPKGTDLSRVIDRQLGFKPVYGPEKLAPDGKPYSARQIEGHTMTTENVYGETVVNPIKWHVQIPQSETAKAWYDYRTCLKPAREDVVLIQKPREGTFVDNILKWGVGGLNIGGSRIDINIDLETDNRIKDEAKNVIQTLTEQDRGQIKFHKKVEGYMQNLFNLKGRYPTNVIVDEAIAELLDSIYETGDSTPKLKFNKDVNRQIPERAVFNPENSGFFKKTSQTWNGVCTYPDAPSVSKSFFKTPTTKAVYGDWSGGRSIEHYGLKDGGGISKFFYVPKASTGEREVGLSDIEPQKRDTTRNAPCDVPQNRNNPCYNFHPTVKPIKLLTYLLRMIKPPTENPIVLDPFAGSGSTGIAARIESCDYILIEKNDLYMEILEKRMKADLKEFEDFTNSPILPEEHTNKKILDYKFGGENNGRNKRAF